MVAPALCFNFLTIFELDNAEFFEVMGNYNIVPLLGRQIPQLFPGALGMVCFYHLSVGIWEFFRIHKKASKMKSIAISH